MSRIDNHQENGAAVAVCRFVLGKSPNPMEGCVKLFKVLVGLYPSVTARMMTMMTCKACEARVREFQPLLLETTCVPGRQAARFAGVAPSRVARSRLRPPPARERTTPDGPPSQVCHRSLFLSCFATCVFSIIVYCLSAAAATLL